MSNEKVRTAEQIVELLEDQALRHGDDHCDAHLDHALAEPIIRAIASSARAEGEAAGYARAVNETAISCAKLIEEHGSLDASDCIRRAFGLPPRERERDA